MGRAAAGTAHTPAQKQAGSFYGGDLKGHEKRQSPWVLCPWEGLAAQAVEVPSDTAGPGGFHSSMPKEICGRILPYLSPGKGLAASFLEESWRGRLNTWRIRGHSCKQECRFCLSSLGGSSFACCSFAYLCLVGYRALRSEFKKTTPAELSSFMS